MQVDVLQGVKHGLHELVLDCLQVVVEQLDPLQAVQVLERRRRDLLDTEEKAVEIVLLRALFRLRPDAAQFGRRHRSSAATRACTYVYGIAFR